MKKWMTLLAVAGLVFALAPAARAAEDDVIDSTTITASSTDVYRSWEPPNKAVDPAGTPGLTGAHPNEVHGINHNSDGQFRNYPPDATPTTIWLKFDLGANYPLKTLRVWNGGFFRLALPEGNGNSGVNEAELYYSSAADDPGDDSSVNWTLISTVNFAAVTGHNGATSLDSHAASRG